MTQPSVTLRLNGDASGLLASVGGARRGFDGLGRAGQQAGQQAAAGTQRIGAGVRSISEQLAQARQDMLALAGVGSLVGLATGLARTADAYTNLSSKIRLVTDSERELRDVREQLFQVAQSTRQDLAATAELYTRLARSTADMGLSQQRLIGITETVNQAFVVSGASATEASAAITQLSQGLASGVLRGEEFNSVAEQAPIIMDLLAKQLDVTRGELRKMAEAGELTAGVLVNALTNGAASVDAQFGQMQLTIGGAVTQLGNAFTKFVGDANEASGAARAVAGAISALAMNLPTIANALLVVATLVAVKLVGSLALAVRGWWALQASQAAAASSAALATVGIQAVNVKLPALAVGLHAAGTAGRAAWLAIGGPIGAIVIGLTAVGTALYSVISGASESRRVFDETIAKMDDLAAKAEIAATGLKRVGEAPPTALADALAQQEEVLETLIAKQRELRETQESWVNLIAGPTTNGLLELVGANRVLSKEYGELTVETRELAEAAETLSAAIRERVAPAMEDAEAAGRRFGAALDDWDFDAAIASLGDLGAAIQNAGGILDADQEFSALFTKLTRDVKESSKAIEDFGKTQAQLARQEADRLITLAETANLSTAQRDAARELGKAYAENAVRLAALEAAQRGANKARTDANRVEREAQRIQEAMRREGEQQFQDNLRNEESLNGFIQALEDEVDQIGLSAEARRRNNVMLELEAMLKAASIDPAYADQLRAETLALLDRGEAAVAAAERDDELQRAAEQSAAEYERAWSGAAERVTFLLADFATGSIRSFKDLSRQIGDTFRRMIADMLAQWARSGITNLFGSMFGKDAGAQWRQFFGSIGQAFSGGSQGGFLSGIGGAFRGLLGGGAAAGTSGATAAATGASGMGAGFMGIPVVGWIMAGMMANDAMFQDGWRSRRSNTTLPNGAVVSGGEGSNLVGRLATAGAVNIADSLFRRLGLSDRMASLLSGSSLHARLFGRSAPRLTGANTTFDLSERGGGGVQYQTLERGGVFRSDRRRTHSFGLSGDALAGAEELFDALQEVMRDAAARLRAEAPARLDAALRVVQEFDKKGQVTATKFLVEALGRSWEEATEEAARTRLSAEAIITTIDAAMDATQAASASAIADRWRGDAEGLMEGAQFLLAASADLRNGFDLLEGAGLEALTDLVEELATGSETLTGTYVRLSQSTQLLQEALQLSGVQLDLTGEALVRFATDITDAAGGLERAQSLWSTYFGTFFSATERAAQGLTSARTGAARQFTDIGLDASAFAGENGAALFRTLFEEQLPSLSAEAIVEWLEAAEALSGVMAAQQAYNDALAESTRAAEEAAARARAAFEAAVAELRAVFEALSQAIAETRSRIADDIQGLRAAAPGFDAAAFQRGRITDLRGQLAGASAADQVGLIDQIREATLARFEAEADQLRAASQADAQRRDEAMQAAEQLHAEAMRGWEAQMQAAARLRDYVDTLGLSNVSPLTAFERFDEAEALYNRALQGSDAAVLQQAAQAFLEETRNVFGVSDRAVGIFNSVRGALGSRADQLSSAAAPVFQAPAIEGALAGTTTAVFDVEAAVETLRAQAIADLEGLDALLVTLRDDAEARFQSELEALEAQYGQAEANTTLIVDAMTALNTDQATRDQAALDVMREQLAALQAANDRGDAQQAEVTRLIADQQVWLDERLGVIDASNERLARAIENTARAEVRR